MDPDGSSIILELVILVFLVFVNAFFAAAEMAVITLNDNKVKKMAEDGNKKAKLVLRLIKSPSSFLATIQVGVTLAGFLSSAVAAETFSDRLAGVLTFLPIAPSVIKGISMVLITLLLSYFTLVFGELVPKRIALQKAEAFSFTVARPLTVFNTVLKPFVAFLSFSTNSVIKLLGFDPNASDDDVTEEEIRMMVDAGEEQGVLEESEKKMINNIFEFGDRTVGEVMTHRTEVSAVEEHSTLEDVLALATQEGFSRIPVYDDDIDNIIGILYVKDLLKYVGNDVPDGFELTGLMRPALFVPETKRCVELFAEFKEKKMQMAIVVDEYGGTFGIVTMEDLLESIVGNIQDEYDNEEEEISKIDDTTFTIDGFTSLDEVSELLDHELPEGDYDTLGGFLINELGRIPEEGETPTIEYDGISFTVTQMDERRIARVRVINPPKPEEEDEDKKESKKESKEAKEESKKVRA